MRAPIRGRKGSHASQGSLQPRSGEKYCVGPR